MTGHNNTTESINTKYLRLLKSVEELKLLQKEIDNAEKTKCNIIEFQVCFGDEPYDYPEFKEACNLQESNQAKIKQIIEEL